MIRRSPVRKKRPGTRRGQATPEEVKAIRLAVYERSGGHCELSLGQECIKGVLPWDGPTALQHGHLVHMKAKRRYGTTLEHSKWGCWHCHLVQMHRGGKVVPAK